MDKNRILSNGGVLTEEAFKLIFLNSRDIITIVKKNGEIIFHSSSKKQKMSYAENDLKGMNILDLVHPDDVKFVAEIFTRATQVAGAAEKVEFRFRNADGSYLVLEAFGNNQLNNPELEAFIINSRDITPLKKIIEEKNQLILELCRMNENLEKYNYITTHNMRGPLTNVLAIAGLLEVEKKHDEELLNGLRISAEFLNQTLTDLILGVESRKLDPLQSDVIYLKELVQSQIEELKEELNRVHAHTLIEINNSLTINFPLNILQFVIRSLIKNAIHYCKESQALELKIRAFENASRLYIEVIDNGLGIETTRLQDRLFGFYQRFHKQSTGRGLSLFLAKSKLEALGCKISVVSELGKGSSFVVEIPIF